MRLSDTDGTYAIYVVDGVSGEARAAEEEGDGPSGGDDILGRTGRRLRLRTLLSGRRRLEDLSATKRPEVHIKSVSDSKPSRREVDAWWRAQQRSAAASGAPLPTVDEIKALAPRRQRAIGEWGISKLRS